jgi:succinate-acetate transporter protein
MDNYLIVVILLIVIILIYSFFESKVLFIYTILLFLIVIFIFLYIENLIITSILKPINNFEDIFNKIKNEYLNKSEFLEKKKEFVSEIKNDLINIFKKI